MLPLSQLIILQTPAQLEEMRAVVRELAPNEVHLFEEEHLRLLYLNYLRTTEAISQVSRESLTRLGLPLGLAVALRPEPTGKWLNRPVVGDQGNWESSPARLQQTN